MTITIDPSILLSYYNSREGILNSSTGASTSSSSTTSASSAASGTVPAPTPPWSAKNASSQANTLATAVLNGSSVIPTTPLQLSVKGASSDYQALFTAYQGLTALRGLVSDALSTSPTATNKAQATQALGAGLTQVSNYVNGLSLQHIELTSGTVQSSDASTSGPATTNSSYTTGVIFAGGLNDPAPAFQGDVQFNINVTSYSGKATTIPIDLSDMGSTPRTMSNVVNYINSQLKAAGVLTRFATSETPGVAQTITVNGKKVTLPAGPDQWAFQINADTSETVSFSAPSTAAAVYVGQTSGNVTGYNNQVAANKSAAAIAAATGTTAPTTNTATQISAPIQQLVKLQTDTSTSATPPPAAQVIPGTPNASPDEAYAQTLNANISSVDATATGADGSVYVLANVTGTVAGDTPTSAQNIALQKYDSAGNLIYSTVLGSAGQASGLSLAVSADGQVAVAGSVTGALSPNNPGNGSTTADSFVAVYNAQGEQQWETTGLSPSNNQVNSVAFGADDSVYVAGQTNTPSGTAASYAPAAGYLAGYSSAGKSLFNISTGNANANGVAVDGNTVVVAGTSSSGHAIVNSYALPSSGSSAPTLTASRDLGSLGSGSIAGVAINDGQVVVAGTTSNASLDAGAVTSAFTGRQDAFVAQLSEDLAPSGSDAIAYYGGTGNTTATALTVSNGQVYIAGSSTGGLPGLTNQGTQEG
ncbi:MAG: hypothetical protein JO303_05535 [Caulobacteraceae bacterium]|nr:hypothetical protein [Caulobacteraceae bacterium]